MALVADLCTFAIAKVFRGRHLSKPTPCATLAESLVYSPPRFFSQGQEGFSGKVSTVSAFQWA